jgi:hypothetical protein
MRCARLAFAVGLLALLAVSAAPRALAVPGEVTNLQWCTGPKDCLQWSVEPSAQKYRVYRGERTSLPCLLNASVESCDHGSFVTTTTGGTVSEVPPAGIFFWYLVTAQDGTGEGTPGQATAGPRIKNDTGACLPSCALSGGSCSVDGDCCSSSCIAGTCQPDCCQGGGAFCTVNSDCCSGTCSGNVCDSPCTSAAQCPGVDTDCQTRTCSAGVCGFFYTSAGTPTATQTPGDCKTAVCDGVGGVTSTPNTGDLPADDGNQCTGEVCNGSTPSHPPQPINSPCSQGGGMVCSAFGTCVQCNSASQCPGTDTDCQQRACSATTCGFSYTSAGTPTGTQTAGNCQTAVCDGTGGVINTPDNSDVPIDGNQCTDDTCTGGVPSNPPSAVGTPCNQGGGTVCNGSGGCVVPPQVVSTIPADSAVVPAGTTITITFSQGMNPSTLTAQTTSGACTGSIQLSLDNFASCVPFATAAPAMSGGNTVATLVPQPGLLVNRTFKIRVTTAAQNASGVPLAATFTQATGFTTTSPNVCDNSLVISQLYGAGGLAGSPLRNDFVELHNRGTVAVSLTGKSIQYASAAGTTWLSQTNLSGSIPPGGYFLIQGASDGANGALLPTPDITGTINMSATTGKLALVANQTSLSGACPLGPTVIDFVGYGSTATCNEGGANAPQTSGTTSITRLQSGCVDLGFNSTDFAAGAPGPRNSSAPAFVCNCVARNESSSVAEADFCAVVFPSTLTVQQGTSTGSIFGQIFEAGTTEPAGAAANVRVQLGFGPPTVNPEYQAGWSWFNAGYNLQVGNNDEYTGSFIAPAAGSYRYAYRFSLDQGLSFTYCDSTAGDGGAGSNTGLNFEFVTVPVLTTTP